MTRTARPGPVPRRAPAFRENPPYENEAAKPPSTETAWPVT